MKRLFAVVLAALTSVVVTAGPGSIGPDQVAQALSGERIGAGNGSRSTAGRGGNSRSSGAAHGRSEDDDLHAALPSMLKRPRYRPGRPWKHDPLWFNGPDDPDAAVAKARPGASGRGGASAEW